MTTAAQMFMHPVISHKDCGIGMLTSCNAIMYLSFLSTKYIFERELISLFVYRVMRWIEIISWIDKTAWIKYRFERIGWK